MYLFRRCFVTEKNRVPNSYKLTKDTDLCFFGGIYVVNWLQERKENE